MNLSFSLEKETLLVILLLQQSKELASLLLGFQLHPLLMLHLRLRNGASHRVPPHRRHAQHSRQHAARHRPYTLRMPPVVLREGTLRQAREVGGTCVPCGVARDGQTLRLTLVDEVLGECVALLGDQGRFDDLERESDFEVPFDVACSVRLKKGILFQFVKGRGRGTYSGRTILRGCQRRRGA